MPKIRRVILELLRDGPSHNQLLSPLTDYLALCGYHASAKVRVPYEHAQFLDLHRSLTYGEDPSGEGDLRRQRVLETTAQEIAGILASVPALPRELRSYERELLHLDLVLSASELAALPFELADTPPGVPGTGQPLTLQSEAPLCLTRRVRSVDNSRYSWPLKPKILFAAASPSGFEPVPIQSHLASLRQVLEPWVRRAVDWKHPASAGQVLAEHLKILPQASPRQIYAEITTGTYKHLHILAHGVEYMEGYDQRFGLALHDDRDPARADKVSASRVATMVRQYRNREGRLADPAVVTLATCYGAGQGSVLGAGSSVAHALHEAGVPLVVSSQFPLSFAGSVLMAQHLYRGLLWGTDPRLLLMDLRRQLRLQVPSTHDWASLVAYMALPKDIDSQLLELRFWQAKRAIEAAFFYVESDSTFWFVRDLSTMRRERLKPVSAEVYKKFLHKLTSAKEKLSELVRQDEDHRRDDGHPLLKPHLGAWVRGLLASTAKREAEVHLRADEPGSTKWRQVLREAQHWYRRAFEWDRTEVWALAQEITLAVVLAPRQEAGSAAWKEKLRHRWWAAYGLLHQDLEDGDQRYRFWAHSNLIELHILWLLLCPESDQPEKRPFRREYKRTKTLVAKHTDEFLARLSDDQGELRSRRRQLERFVSFFFQGSPIVVDAETIDPVLVATSPTGLPRGLVAGLAWEILERLPETQAP